MTHRVIIGIPEGMPASKCPQYSDFGLTEASFVRAIYDADNTRLELKLKMPVAPSEYPGPRWEKRISIVKGVMGVFIGAIATIPLAFLDHALMRVDLHILMIPTFFGVVAIDFMDQKATHKKQTEAYERYEREKARWDREVQRTEELLRTSEIYNRARDYQNANRAYFDSLSEEERYRAIFLKSGA